VQRCSSISGSDISCANRNWGAVKMSQSFLKTQQTKICVKNKNLGGVTAGTMHPKPKICAKSKICAQIIRTNTAPYQQIMCTDFGFSHIFWASDVISVNITPRFLFSHIFRADVFSKFCESFSELPVSCELGGSSHPELSSISHY